MNTPNDLVAEYVESLRSWARLQDDPSRANDEFDRGERCFAELLRTEDARNSILSVLETGKDDWVRLRAATHLLYWAAPEGVAALEELAANARSLCRTSAKWTLRAYLAGTLTINDSTVAAPDPIVH